MSNIGEWIIGTLIVVGIIIGIALFGMGCFIGAAVLLLFMLFLTRPILSIVLVIILIYAIT